MKAPAKVAVASAGLLLMGLVLLLVRENEGRVSAEQKVRLLQDRLDRVSVEQDNAITTLEAQSAELESRLKQSEDERVRLAEQKDSEIAALHIRSQEQAARHAAELSAKDGLYGQLKERADSDLAQIRALLERKSAELKDLGAELQTQSARHAKLIQRTEELEAETVRLRREISGSATDRESLRSERDTLSARLAECEQALRPAD